MPSSYCCTGSTLAEIKITATLQQRGEYLGPIGIVGIESKGARW